MKSSIAFAAFVVTLGPVFLWADEGRVPIAGPTTITAPGHYILTRNIQVTGATGIVIGATRVTLDLNGHVISSTDTTNRLIEIAPTADIVTIRYGRLSGGASGISASSTVGLSIWLENLEIDSAASEGIFLAGATHAELLNSRLINNTHGMYLEGLSANATTGRIEGNTIGGGVFCLSLLRPKGMLIRNNMITSCGQQSIQLGIPGVTVIGYGGNLIEENVISDSWTGPNIAESVPGNQVVGNVLKGNRISLSVNSTSNRVAGNTIFGSYSTSPCGGVCVGGPANFVEGNTISETSSACAIGFSGVNAVDNAYRNNFLRHNAGAVCVSGGASATDAGGNIL